jgi:hypothetical protein
MHRFNLFCKIILCGVWLFPGGYPKKKRGYRKKTDFPGKVSAGTADKGSAGFYPAASGGLRKPFKEWKQWLEHSI